jgi:hypothetical protein
MNIITDKGRIQLFASFTSFFPATTTTASFSVLTSDRKEKYAKAKRTGNEQPKDAKRTTNLPKNN